MPSNGGTPLTRDPERRLDTRWERWLRSSTASLSSAGRGTLWIIPSRPKDLSYFSGLLLLLAGSPAVYGQAAPTASAEQIQALQKKLDALQSQMTEVQGELQRLSGGTAPPTHEPEDLSSAIAAVQQDEKSKVEAELTPKKIELGKATVTYRTFAQDPVAAPRINNEPLDPRFPGFFRLPGTSTLLRIGGYAKTDFIYDLKPAGNIDSFIPATIPIPSPRALTTRRSP